MGKTRAYGSDCQLLAAFESTYGTAPSGAGGAVYTKLSFKEISLGAERPLGYDPLLGQGRDAQDPYYDAITVEGDIGIPIDLRAIGFILTGLMGEPTTTGAGPYTHVWKSGGALPSLTLELGHTGLTVPKFMRDVGCKLDGLSFDMSRTGPANASVKVVAQGETEEAAAVDAAPNTYALTRFSQGTGSIKLDGAQLASVTGGKLNFSNNLEKVETIRSDGKIDGVDETEATAEGSVDVRFGTDSTITDAVDAETPVALEYSFTTGAYSIKFALPRAFLPKKKGEVKGPGGISASYDWRAAKDSTEGCLLKVTLVNDVASYAIP